MAKARKRNVPIARLHAEWIGLLQVSGPFLSLPVLSGPKGFPQGLDSHDSEVLSRLRLAYAEWQEGQRDPEIHRAWTRFVIGEVLEHVSEVVREDQGLPQGLSAPVPVHGETLRPDLALVSPQDTKGAEARLLIRVYPPGTALERPLPGKRWKESAAGRMATLLRGTQVRLGLVTNGEQWMLVDAPREKTAGFTSWFADLWLAEHVTLRAFRSLLGPLRFFGVPADETIEALLTASRENEQEVSDQLGRQVRRAVEILVRTLDRANRDTEGELLGDTPEAHVYEAAVSFMMRLVFLFAAEERGLLPLEDPLYNQHYAASTLREQLRQSADEHGEEILERRRDAWLRLLALTRAVHRGILHEAIPLPAYGGRLFDPDRYPFLEGRAAGTSWQEARSRPLPVDNRTVLHLLGALQVLQDEHLKQAQRVSFKGLSIEQIGHVYEGLLDRTAKRAQEPLLIVNGKGRDETDVSLSDLEAALADGEKPFAKYMKALTGRGSPAAVRKALARKPAPELEQSLLTACNGDAELTRRARVFAEFMAVDSSGRPRVVLPGGLYVTTGSSRRQTGTHYTPRMITESVVRNTLEPLVYAGAKDGRPPEEWVLLPPRELLALRVCDLACGSAAFLVQACRYLAERLLESWESATGDSDLPFGEDSEENLALARRLITDRCLYGVDRNGMAIEMAKLSLWLITMQRDRPFTFLNHCLRVGDSLLGCARSEQLAYFDLNPTPGGAESVYPLFGDLSAIFRPLLDAARNKRLELEHFPVITLADQQRKQALLDEAEASNEVLVLVGDLLIGAYLARDPETADLEALLGATSQRTLAALRRGDKAALAELRVEANRHLALAATEGDTRCFHWPIEFPEVFDNSGSNMGFDAIIANPPFANAIEAETARSEELSRYAKHVYQPFAIGAYDYCLLFWARTLLCLLSPEGTFGIMGPTALLSDAKDWQRWMHDHWRPRFLQLLPVDQFSDARIRTTAFVGCAGTASTLRVLNLDTGREQGEEDTTPVTVSWPDPLTSWYEVSAASVGGPDQESAIQLGLLSDLLDVGAGCATGAAYELKPLVVDDLNGPGQRLVTTGLLDRFECHWGDKRVRYLKVDYAYPRWPTGAEVPRAVARASSRQVVDKILVGGLTAVLEAWLDTAGTCAGVVSTWVIQPKKTARNRERLLWRAVGLINSATFTRIYMSRYGGKSMSGRQTTIQKKSLLAMPIPPDLASAPAEDLTLPRLLALGTEPVANTRGTAASLLEAASRKIQSTVPSDPTWEALDRAIHYASGVLYGLSPAGIEADYEIWCERCRKAPEPLLWDTLARQLLAHLMSPA